MIEFQDFSCYYKQNKDYIAALRHVNLQVYAGEFLAVVGPSGSGKTTLLRACMGTAGYFEGELTIDGEPIEKLNLKLGRYAYVSQEMALYPHLTVFENLAYPLRVMHTHQAEVDSRVREIAEQLEIGFLLNRKPRQLSLGQQQRVAIGRAVIKNPDFIYFDEPFSNIDPALRGELQKLVKSLHRQLKPTVIFVTHDMNEAFGLADRIVMLEEGTITRVGTPKEWIQQEFVKQRLGEMDR